jgi:hypothetical protein
MKQDEIIEMARQSGWSYMESGMDKSRLEAFAKLVAAKEREECAKLVEGLQPVGIYRELERATFKDAAIAIRARGEA